MNEIMKALDAELYGSKSKSPDKDLKNVILSLSFDFPIELKELLLEFNGAIFFNNGAKFKPEGKCNLASKDGYLSLNTIYGIADNDNGILRVNHSYDDQIPDLIIIIAESDGGNQICIERNTGIILFWNHEGIPNVDELFNIAPSFAEFLQKIEVEDDNNLNNPDLDGIEFTLDF